MGQADNVSSSESYVVTCPWPSEHFGHGSYREVRVWFKNTRSELEEANVWCDAYSWHEGYVPMKMSETSSFFGLAESKEHYFDKSYVAECLLPPGIVIERLELIYFP